MGYLNQLQSIEYDGQTIDNIFFQYVIPSEYYRGDLFQTTTVQPGDRPEIISEVVYGTNQLWWLVLKYNNMINAWDDWPMGIEEIEEKAKIVTKRQYGDVYTPKQYNDIYVSLFEKNSTKLQIRLPFPQTVLNIVANIDDFFAQQRQ